LVQQLASKTRDNYKNLIEESGYGVVYTPPELADFVSKIVLNEIKNDKSFVKKEKFIVLDPSCGENALLNSLNRINNRKFNMDFIGVDVDKNVINNNKKLYSGRHFIFDSFDSILPTNQISTEHFWKLKFDSPNLIISNPPWSSNRIYDKNILLEHGFTLSKGQYDSYELFIELCLNIVADEGYCAFILPDSVFSDEKSNLRKLLLEKSSIKVIARLGEKIFEGVHRATTVIITKKCKPTKSTKTKCFRLATNARKDYLSNNIDIYRHYIEIAHFVKQDRFCKNLNYNFDIDTQEQEESLIRKIEQNKIDWNSIFKFNRGVEISKQGLVVVCPHCEIAQGISKKQINAGNKSCKNCSKTFTFSKNDIESVISTSKGNNYTKIYVGENIQRYYLKGNKYIIKNKKGIDYKSKDIYIPPKILIRKTGLGINACIDYDSTYISQTVYSCNYIKENNIPLEYYLGVLNSRVMYYYYLKLFGENEWKSHPYFTKEIVFCLPIRQIDNTNMDICLEIANLTKKIINNYSRDIDFQIENLVYKLYNLTDNDVEIIKTEINKLPNLCAINHMKY